MMFIGAFNKKNNFCDSKWANEKLGLQYTFDERLLEKAGDHIKRLLGDKQAYTVQDAYKYFHIAYGAYQIDYRQFYNYCHTEKAKFLDDKPTIDSDKDIELLAEEGGSFFSYLAGGKFTDEKVIALVIDSYVLGELLDVDCADNLILVIGSFDEKIINSMKVILNPNISQIEYALEFFRLHS